MDRSCVRFVAACFTCQLERARFDSNRGWRGLLIPPPPGPCIEWAIDLLTELPHADHKKHVLVCVDTFSKYVVLASLPDRTSSTVATVFRERVLSVFGIP